MRLPLALGALLLAAPALAQVPEVELVEVEIRPFDALIPPLQGAQTTTITTRVSCALADGLDGVPVAYAVREAPTWATTVVSPAEDRIAAQGCDAGWLTATASLVVSASDQAPAFLATPIVVEATAGPSTRQEKASAEVSASATYFSILDVQLPLTMTTVAPGETVEFPMQLTNFGNGPTRVETTIAADESTTQSGGAGLDIVGPAPVTLESKQSGGTRISDTAVVRVTARPEDGFVNRVYVVNAQLRAAYATDDSHAGDSSTASFLVTVRSGILPAKEAPAAGPALLVAAAAGLALALRRRA